MFTNDIFGVPTNVNLQAMNILNQELMQQTMLSQTQGHLSDKTDALAGFS